MVKTEVQKMSPSMKKIHDLLSKMFSRLEIKEELKKVESEIKYWDNKEVTSEELLSGLLFVRNEHVQSLFEKRDYLKECLKECKN